MKKRKVLSLLLVPLALAALLCGCGKQEGAYSYGHIALILPQDFEVQKNTSYLAAFPPDYPEHTDNISVVESFDLISSYTRDNVERFVSSSVHADVTLSTYEALTIDGHDAVVYSYTLPAQESSPEMRQTQYAIFGKDYCDVVTFTSVSGIYDDAFQACAQTIRVI